MIEVFKTNVEFQHQADMLIDKIHIAFSGYKANFDLHDCDKILRVKYTTAVIQSLGLIELLNKFGFTAEILPDNCPPRAMVTSIRNNAISHEYLK